jgi:hypothetical protein
MKEERESQIAWEVWNLLEKLNDLLWNRYEKEFIDLMMAEEQEQYLRTIGLPREEETDPSG